MQKKMDPEKAWASTVKEFDAPEQDATTGKWHYTYRGGVNPEKSSGYDAQDEAEAARQKSIVTKALVRVYDDPTQLSKSKEIFDYNRGASAPAGTAKEIFYSFLD